MHYIFTSKFLLSLIIFQEKLKNDLTVLIYKLSTLYIKICKIYYSVFYGRFTKWLDLI